MHACQNVTLSWASGRLQQTENGPRVMLTCKNMPAAQEKAREEQGPWREKKGKACVYVWCKMVL